MDQVFKNNYFRYLFSSTLYPLSPVSVLQVLIFFHRVEYFFHRVVPFKQQLSADIESCYRCLQVHCFSMPWTIISNFPLILAEIIIFPTFNDFYTK